MARITVKPLSPHVGAEIAGVDLTRPLTAEQVNELKDALGQCGVIFFREQPIDLEQHRRFAGYFGELHIHVGGEGTASNLQLRCRAHNAYEAETHFGWGWVREMPPASDWSSAWMTGGTEFVPAADPCRNGGRGSYSTK